MQPFATLPGLAGSILLVCAALVFYVYVGYPALVWVLSRMFGANRRPAESADRPFLSVVIAAHNEESVMAERVSNLLALDYPADRLEIIIASDGSSDRTCEIARSFDSPLVKVLEFSRNRGKAAVLNDAIAAARGEVLLLSDANTMLDPQAARRLVRWFSDPNVGVVCGRLVLVDAVGGQNVDGLYWKYETFLKNCEARLGALLGANGAIYAIRTELYPRLSHRIAVDDFVIPLLAHLSSGRRIEFEAEAVAFEETAPEVSGEFARRSRIGAGGFQSLSLLWPLFNPLRGWLALSFISHKFFRWVCPFFLVGALAASAVGQGPAHRAALLLQLSLYLVAYTGYIWPRLGSMVRVTKLPTMFAAMNLALMVGFFRWAMGRQSGVWARTARTGV